MFVEYAIYCDGKVVALVCDDQLFVKPTAAGRALVDLGEGEVIAEAPPYPAAKPYFVVSEQLDDRDWMTRLIQATADELPAPKPRTAKARRVK